MANAYKHIDDDFLISDHCVCSSSCSLAVVLHALRTGDHPVSPRFGIRRRIIKCFQSIETFFYYFGRICIGLIVMLRMLILDVPSFIVEKLVKSSSASSSSPISFSSSSSLATARIVLTFAILIATSSRTAAAADHQYAQNYNSIHISTSHSNSIEVLNFAAAVTTPPATASQSAAINTGCPASADSACLRCNFDGCIKCPDLLIQDTRACVMDACPSGYLQQWSASPELMGKICTPQGMSAPLLAVITGLIFGCIICVSCLMIAVILIKRRRRKSAIKKKLINETTMDRSDFLRQLDEMRPNAEYFLAMLNDTRRQIRKLYLSGEVDTANAYRPVIRDLAKILILLNRPIELIPAPPHDWTHIYMWAEQSLDKYKPKIGQLIDFLQTPATGTTTTTLQSNRVQNGGGLNGGGLIGEYYDSGGSLQFSDNYGGSLNGDLRAYQLHQNHQQLLRNKNNFQLFGSLISLHDLESGTARQSDPFGSNFNTLRHGGGGGPGGNGLGLITDLNASSLWLEDEFFRLGFRPQDEITTEL